MLHNLWDPAKAVPKEKFIMINAYIRNQERSQINLTLHLKEAEREQTKDRVSGGKEITKIRVEVNGRETKRQ